MITNIEYPEEHIYPYLAYFTGGGSLPKKWSVYDIVMIRRLPNPDLKDTFQIHVHYLLGTNAPQITIHEEQYKALPLGTVIKITQ